jgi:hypothetical protein
LSQGHIPGWQHHLMLWLLIQLVMMCIIRKDFSS